MAVLTLDCHHFLKDGVKAARYAPGRVVALEFRQIRDVTDMIALSRLFGVGPVDFPASEGFDSRNCLQHRNTVAPASAEVVDFARLRIPRKLLKRAHHIKAMNVVADLFAFIAIYGIGT